MTLTIPSGYTASEIDAAIEANQKYQTWQSSPNHQGYSGVQLVNQGDGTAILQVIWTDDGVYGYPRVFTVAQEQKLQQLVNQYVANHPLA